MMLYLKSHCHTQSRLDRSPVLSFRSFIVLCFMFMSVIHFELIFVIVIRLGSICVCAYIYFACGYSVIPAPFVEKATSPLHSLCFFVRDQFAVFLWVCFCSLFYSIDLCVHYFASTILF